MSPRHFTEDEREAFLDLLRAGTPVERARSVLGFPGRSVAYHWQRSLKVELANAEEDSDDPFEDHALIRAAVEAAEADPPKQSEIAATIATIAEEQARQARAFRNFEATGERGEVGKDLTPPTLPDLRLLGTAEHRRLLTRHDPLLFGRLYLPDHLLLRGETEPSFSAFHLALCEEAKAWTWPHSKRLEGPRDVFIAPREAGKSTWLFLILPLWATAHGHLEFVAAFSDSDRQATEHLMTLRTELDSNRALEHDYPKLCRVARRSQDQRKAADRLTQTRQSNGAIFLARGIDARNLGIKVGRRRPDLILLDDIEPHEESYSADSMQKRLRTVENAVLPMNASARAVMVGTVTMAGSLIHQAVKTVKTSEDPAEWITDGRFRVSYWPAIVEREDGSERSLWPHRWPIGELQARRHLRSFALSMQNDPIAGAGALWSSDEIVVADPGEFGETVMTIDPAVTAGARSDYTAIVVASRALDNDWAKPVYVREAKHFRLRGDALRHEVRRILLAMNHSVRRLVVETNQGGDLWQEALGWDDLVREFPELTWKTRHESEKKELRVRRAEERYGRGLVRHVRRFAALEEEMLAFPDHLHDDLVDALATALAELPAADVVLATVVAASNKPLPKLPRAKAGRIVGGDTVIPQWVQDRNRRFEP